MKFSLSLTLSFILFAFITKLALSEDDFVRDTDGRLMFPGSRFYILSEVTDGPGVSLGKTGDLKCPVTVLQNYNHSDFGLPVKFRILGYSIGYIATSEPLDIDFLPGFKDPRPIVPDCAKSSKWLVYVDSITKKAFVGIGGPENYPGKHIINGTFGIRHNGKYKYKLVFCLNRRTCLDIGRYDNDEGGRRLTLNLTNNEPVQVVFQKADPFFKTSVIT